MLIIIITIIITIVKPVRPEPGKPYKVNVKSNVFIQSLVSLGFAHCLR